MTIRSFELDCEDCDYEVYDEDQQRRWGTYRQLANKHSAETGHRVRVVAVIQHQEGQWTGPRG